MVESNKEYREKSLGAKVFLISYPEAAESSRISAKEATVSASTISALNKVDSNGGALIQTDHMVRAGAYGGALVNEKGELIGILRRETRDKFSDWIKKLANSLKAKDPSSPGVAEQAFATPSNFIADYLKTKQVQGYTYTKIAAANIVPVAAKYPAPVAPDSNAVTSTKTFEQPTEKNNLIQWSLVAAGVLTLCGIGYFVIWGRSKPASNANKPDVNSAASNSGTRSTSKVISLKYIGGDSLLQGKQWPFTKEGAIIGRSGEIRINSKEASNEHARIFLNQGEPMIEHLSSTNSTLVNNSSITGKVSLKQGDKIQIAKGGVDLFLVEIC